MIKINESGVTFGPFPEDSVYENDKSSVLPQHVKAVEFTLLNKAGSKLVFVEAKSSFSRPDNVEDFEKNLNEIFEKLVDSLSTLAAAHLELQREVHKELPNRLRAFNWQTCGIFMRLVIPKFEDSWLAPISDKLRARLQHFLASFGIPLNNFQVVNERLAKKQKLIR